MKKIAFFITSLNIGGAERVLVDLVNNLNNKYDITVITLYGRGELEKELKCKIVNINSNPKRGIMKKIYALTLKFKYFQKQIIKNYFNDFDLVISFLEGVSTEILSSYKGKKIAFVHTDLSKHYSKLYNLILPIIYKSYNHIVSVSNDSLKSLYNIKTSKSVIYNYISYERVKKLANEYMINDENYILTIARLFEEKGVKRIIEINRKLIKDKINLNFIVIGDGPLMDELKKIIIKEKMNNIKLLGLVNNPFPYLSKANLLLIPSLYEGLSLVALEGRLLNKKIIATKTGVVEALAGYDKAYISQNNVNDLYETLKLYSLNKIKFTKIKGDFSNDLESYITLFDKILML